MGKGLAITGFVLSLVFAVAIIFSLYSPIYGWIILFSTIVGFIINLIVLIKKLDGKKFAIWGIILNIVMILLSYVIPYFLG